MDNSKARILIIFTFISLAFLLVLVTVFKRQVFPDPRLAEISSQYEAVKYIPVKRGNIVDRKNNPLAITVDYDRLCVDPGHIKDKSELMSVLSKELNMSVSELKPKIYPDDPNKRYIKVKNKLSRQESLSLKGAFKKTKDYGLIFEPVPTRFYPNKNLASHVIGFINNDICGVDGVEKVYDDNIKIAGGKIRYRKDNKGNPIYDASKPELFTQTQLSTVTLTIDREIQYQAERALKATVEKWKAVSGTVLIMDPNNGEIITLANYPDYDPNHIDPSDGFALRNRAVTDIFEPGSTFKIFTAGIALKYGVTDLKEKFWGESGNFKVKNRVIREAKGHDYGWMTLRDIIAKSSNVGSAKLGLKIGARDFMKGIRSFGFGSKTHVDLPGEVSGLIQSRVGDVELSNMAFGQGISVTAIQMAKAYSIIANGGYNVKPHIVKKIVSGEGQETLLSSSDMKGEQIIKEDIAKTLGDMLRSVVEEGTATGTDISGFDVGGKTGTAQKPVKGGYSKDKYVASFVGFFPVHKPMYTIFVAIDEPKGSHYASMVAVPLFRTLANVLIQNSNVSFRPKENNTTNKVVDERHVEAKSPETITVDPLKVPDLRGLTLRDALRVLSKNWSDVKVEGVGRVVRQVPESGPRNPDDKVMTIWLE